MNELNFLIEDILHVSAHPGDDVKSEFIGLALKGRLIAGEIKQQDNLVLKSGNDQLKLNIKLFAYKRKKINFLIVSSKDDIDEIVVKAKKDLYLDFRRKNRQGARNYKIYKA